MRITPALAGLLIAMLLVLTGCQKTRAEILGVAKDIHTPARLKLELGPPDRIERAGPLSKWVYNAKDGVVVFAIDGDTFTVSSAAGD